MVGELCTNSIVIRLSDITNPTFDKAIKQSNGCDSYGLEILLERSSFGDSDKSDMSIKYSIPKLYPTMSSKDETLRFIDNTFGSVRASVMDGWFYDTYRELIGANTPMHQINLITITFTKPNTSIVPDKQDKYEWVQLAWKGSDVEESINKENIFNPGKSNIPFIILDSTKVNSQNISTNDLPIVSDIIRYISAQNLGSHIWRYLMPEEFEIKHFESIMGMVSFKPVASFRKRVSQYIEGTNTFTKGNKHRPSELFKFK